jgi:hypothetical protein
MSTVLSKRPDSGTPVHKLQSRPPGWKTWSERFVLATLILLFAVKGFAPAWRHLNSDFPNSYLVARLYREGYPLERVYEWTWFQRQKDHRGIEQRLVGFIPQTLASAMLVAPLSSFPPLKAKRWWLVENLFFLILIVALLTAMTKLGPRRVSLLVFLAVIPLRDGFLLGQTHLFLLLLFAASAWLYFGNRFFGSGITLAAGAALKIYPALFLIFFMCKRQWRAASGLALGMIASGLVSIYLFGLDACRFYVRAVLPWAMRGQTMDPYDVTWGSLGALLSRMFIAEPELNPSPIAHLPWLYSFLYPLIVASIFSAFIWALLLPSKNADRKKIEWASYLFLLLLVSSQPAAYHFVSLILPTVLVTDYLLVRGNWVKAAILVGVYVLACGSYNRFYPENPTGWQAVACFPRLFLMIVFGGLLLWILKLSSNSTEPRTGFSPSIVAGLVFVGMFASGFISNVRHSRGQFDNYSSRVVVVPGSALAFDPVTESGDLFFGALGPRFLTSVPDGYAVFKQVQGGVVSFNAGGDWFHPAVGRNRDIAWAEVAATGGSRVVRFAPSSPVNSMADTRVEVEDAEQPVVSSDGQLLAFIREVQGRSSLWVRPIGSGNNTDAQPERQIAGPEYDVRDVAFFPDHNLVFSSRRNGQFRLFQTDSMRGVIREMSIPNCSARYPALSPDGQRLAFSCEGGGVWQLYALDLHTFAQLQLTRADCNSISPAWMPNSRDIVYATDCGRGLGINALVKLRVVN